MQTVVTSTRAPLISIVTPSFNQGRFIEATIRSVIEQSYPNIEFIVIDAMSTDETREILDVYGKKISLVLREYDSGQSDAIVKGFRLAKGELVGWINSDDVLYPDCVARIVETYNSNRGAVLFYNSTLDVISESGQLKRTVRIGKISSERLLRVCPMIVQPGSFYRKDALESVSYLETKLRYSMDLDLWLRLLRVGDCVDLKMGAIAAYREWSGTKTSTGSRNLIDERLALLKHHGARRCDRSILFLRFARLKLWLRDFSN